MSAYLLAKEAALVDLAEMIDAGAGTADVLGVIQETLDQPIAKHASEEDVEARLGIESVCYDFLKTASQYYAVMEVADESEAMLDCFVKVAEEAEAEKEKGRLARMKDYTVGKAKGALGAIKRNPKKSVGAAAATLAALYGGKKLME